MSHLFRSSVMLLLLTSYKKFKPVFTIKNNNICPIQSSQYHVIARFGMHVNIACEGIMLT